MTTRSYQALKKMKTEIFVHKKSTDILQAYNEWAETYEDDIDAIGYQIHDESAEVLLRHLQSEDGKLRVLDVLSGTGLVGVHLRRRGYVGTLHGVDGSQEMIKKAKAKNVYQEITQQHLQPGKEILGGCNAEYDGITCVGGFLQGHLDPKIVPEVVQLLKIGGYLVYTARESVDNDGYRLPLEIEAKQLVESGKLRKIEIVKTSYGVDWDVDDYTDPDCHDRKPSPVYIYCYQRQ